MKISELLNFPKLCGIAENIPAAKPITEMLIKDEVYVNPKIATIKSIAFNNEDGIARFVIYKDNTIVAADASYHTHTSMAPDRENWFASGGVTYLPKDRWFYTCIDPIEEQPIDHPFLHRLEKFGIKNGNRQQVRNFNQTWNAKNSE